MKIKNVLILVFVLAALSIATYSISYRKSTITQVTGDISLEEFRDCETVYWTEMEDLHTTCTMYYNNTVCDDEPFNTSCYTEEQSYKYRCKTGEIEVEKSREECKETEMEVTIDTLLETKNYKLEYGEWGRCSYETEGETLVITCDSKYDGNNDGICHPGESCIQFRITKDKIQRLMKNSRMDFLEEDETFFLEELSMGVVK